MIRTSLFTVLLIAGAVGTLPSQQGRLLFEAYGAGFSRGGGYGTSIVVLGDVDKDRVPDIAVGEPFGGRSLSGLVDLISGKTGKLIRRLVPASGDNGIGVHVANARDINGDGVRDVITASARRVSIYSGANGAVIRSFNVTRASGVAGVGDWNSDTFRDVAWVAAGSLHVASGKDGSILATVTGLGARDIVAVGLDLAIVGSRGVQYFRRGQTKPAWTVAGYTQVADAGDFNRDSRLDVITLSTTATDVLSGADGKLIRRFPAGTSARGRFDLNGDGVPEVVIGNSRENSGAGAARVYSGKDGQRLWEYFGRERSDALGHDVASHPNAGSPGGKAMIASALSRYNGSVDAGSVLAIRRAASGETDGWFRPFGRNCNFNNERIRPGRDFPKVGKTYGFRFDSSTRPQGFLLLVLGASRTKWNGINLPIRLPGGRCDLFVGPDVLLPAGLQTFVSLPIPNTASLAGTEVFVQGLSLFSSTFTTSDAASLRVGN